MTTRKRKILFIIFLTILCRNNALANSAEITSYLNELIYKSCVAYEIVRKYSNSTYPNKMISDNGYEYDYYTKLFGPDGAKMEILDLSLDPSYKYPDTSMQLYACNIPHQEYVYGDDSLKILISTSDLVSFSSNKILVAYSIGDAGNIFRLKYLSGKLFKTEIWHDFESISNDIISNIQYFIKFKCFNLEITSCEFVKQVDKIYYFKVRRTGYNKTFQLVFDERNPDVVALYCGNELVWRNDKVFEQSLFGS